MSCGKPVVSINFRASADFIVSGVNGFLYDDDRGNMAETIMKAIHADPHISRNARRTAEIYSKENCARSLSQLYSKLVRMDLSR